MSCCMIMLSKNMVKKQNSVLDTYSFIAYIKTYDVYEHIAEDVETSFKISNCELDKRFPKGKHKKVIRLMKDELGWNNDKNMLK